MVQPASAAVTSASRCATGPACARAPARRAPGAATTAAAAVTQRELPAWQGAANSTGTSAVSVPPGSGAVTRAGSGVRTPGPSTRTSIAVPAPVTRPGSSLASATWMICSGRWVVPANKSVDVTPVIRISPSSHAARAGARVRTSKEGTGPPPDQGEEEKKRGEEEEERSCHHASRPHGESLPSAAAGTGRRSIMHPGLTGVSAVSGSWNWSPKPTVAGFTAGFTGRPACPASGGGT